MSATPRPWRPAGSGFRSRPSIVGRIAGKPVTVAEFERADDRDVAIRAVNSFDDLVTALDLLLADVQAYEAWERPCHAVDVARDALAKARATP